MTPGLIRLRDIWVCCTGLCGALCALACGPTQDLDAADGSAESVEILRSSGHAVLDDDLTQTVRRAGPYPLYSGWVRLPFTYRLAE